MLSDVLDNECTGRSPCRECPRHLQGLDKNECVDKCDRLAAYRNGEPWEEKEMVEMGETEIRDQRSEVGDQKSEIGSQKSEVRDQGLGPCVICHDPDKKVLNKRSQTCGACYQAWNVGKVDHPTLGKFKPSLIKSKIKTSAAKKDQKSEIRKGQMSEVGDQKSEVKETIGVVKESADQGEKVQVKMEKSMSKDSKASYYDAGGIETLDIIKAKLTPEQYKGYLLGCSLKYQCRLMHKFDDKDRVRDAEKAANYSLWLLEAFKG